VTETATDRAEAIRARLRDREGTGLRTFATPDPIVWARTSGSRVTDANGREYVDLQAGFVVANVGYCHPRVTEALVRQAGVMTHCPSGSPSELRADFYDRLAAITPKGLDRFLPALGGSLATEIAVNLARTVTGRDAVISFSGTYVGRTTGAVRLAGKREYRRQVRVAGGAHFVPFPDPYRSPWANGDKPAELALALVEQMLTDPGSGIDPVACIIVEPIQGNAGVVIPDESFLPGLRRLCDRSGALLIFDEIQSGFGRTGRMWAQEHTNVVPDLMTMGKGLGGGLPIAAVAGREDLMTTWEPDAVTSTFIANALTLAAANAAIDVMRDEGLVERSANLGADALVRLQTALADSAIVGDVRGRGLFIGIEIVTDRTRHEPDAASAATAAAALRERGFIIGRGGRYGNVLKLAPPLVISEDELSEAINAVSEVLE
jgi:4-aminobutyrate aminotransferase-like enzyme